MKPPGFSDGAWLFPERLVQAAKLRGWYQAQIGEAAEVTQGTVSRWLSYEVAQPDPQAVRRLEKKLEIPPGSLLQEPNDGITPPRNVVLEQLQQWAARLGMDESVVATLTDEKLGASFKQFSREIRGAILGLVHVYRVPLERAISIADGVRKAHPRMVRSPDGNELYWYSLMAAEVGKKESGQFPSSSHIKIVE